MKTLKWIGLSLMGILLGFNFISCSSDSTSDEIDNGIITNQKKLVQVKSDEDYGYCWDFSYDSKGRLASVEYREIFDYDSPEINASVIELSYIDWGENSITRTTSRQGYSDDDIVEFSLSDGLVWQITDDDGDNGIITYNSKKQLSVFMDNNSTTSLTWEEDNKVTSVVEAYNYDSYTRYSKNIMYSDRKCQGYFPLFYDVINVFIDDIFLLVHPELFGLRSNSLPIRLITEYDGETRTYEYAYTFDKEGYVESFVERCTSSIWGLSTTNYSLKWE